MDLDASTVPIGDTLEFGWYDYPAYIQITQAITQGEHAFMDLLDRQNIDAVIVGRNSERRGVGGGILAALRAGSQSIEHEGELIVFHLNPEIRFDEFVQVSPNPDNLQLQGTPPLGSYSWQIEYRCHRPGSILRVDVSEGNWDRLYSAVGLCDGNQSEWTTPLLSADGKDGTIVWFKDFDETLEFGHSGYWFRAP